MMEQETKEAEKPEIKKSKIAEMKQGNEELKALIEERELLLRRSEDLEQKKILGGITDAGQSQVPIITLEQKEKNDRIKTLGEATGAYWAKKML